MELLLSLPGRRADVEAWLREPGRGERIKENRVRAVHRWNGLYVKEFKHPGWLRKLRSRVNDPALHEHRVLLALRGRGIAAPAPAAWARAGGSTFVFTEEIPGAVVLREAPLPRPLLRDLAAFVRGLHDAGFRHDDLHLGNILLAGGRLHLVDVHRARLGDPLTPAERAEALGFLSLSLSGRAPVTDVLRVIRAYGADAREVDQAYRAARERYWRDRQSRVRRNGSDFEVADGLVLRRPFGAEEARKALEGAPLRVVKETPRRRLWLVDGRTFVKEGARGLWHNGFALETRGIPTPRLLACRGDRVVGEWIEGALPLWEHLRARGVSRALVGRLARLVRQMHARGVFHRDLKANNILVRGDDVWVVDLDRVDFLRDVPRPARVLNLAQLNAAVGPPATPADRLRFFFAYAGRDRAIRMNWKSWVREIMKRTVERGHHWPTKNEARIKN